MRKPLGLFAALCALCAMSWAQAPSDNPPPSPPYPRFELSGGYSYARTDLFNSGDTARLNGWNGSLGVNAAKWLGFVFEASGLYGNSKIPVAVPAPFPTCFANPGFCPPGPDTFNVNTKMYNYLLGAQFPYRKWQRWTPFAEVLLGHSGVRGESRSIDNQLFVEASGGWGLLGGIGADYNIDKRYAMRFKADYVQSRVFKQKQDNILLSVGIVIRSVPKKKKTLEDITPPVQ